MDVFQTFVQMLLPLRCIECQREGGMLCNNCVKQLKFFSPHCFYCQHNSAFGAKTHSECIERNTHFSCFAVLFHYTKIIKRLFATYKYTGAYRYGEIIKQLIDHYMLYDPFNLLKYNFNPQQRILLIPVPMHEHKLKQRGFSPALQIACWASQSLQKQGYSAQTNATSFIKTKQTKAQAGLKKRERLLNQIGIFAQLDEQFANTIDTNTHILIVDDVVSSGATALSMLETVAKTIQNTDIKISLFAFARG
jgi:predicted amidophosphoribosyltransferase